MKGVIGNPARKEQYFKRERVRQKIEEALLSNANLVISAPRRIGKTSIMYNLLDEPLDGYYPIFFEAEDIYDEDTFFKEILDKISDLDKLQNIVQLSRQSIKSLKEFFSRIKSVNVDIKGEFGLELKEENKLNYYEEFRNLVDSIDLGGYRLLIMIDEFPVTIENINSAFGKGKAIEFLQKNRKLRQDDKISEKLQFIYTGSIGLYSVVSGLEATGEINDLRSIRVLQLTLEEGQEMITKLIGPNNIEKIDTEYLLEVIEWRIPFYIQLMVDEIKDLIEIESTLTGKELVNKAFDELIDHVNFYFDHFRTRLNKSLNGNELKFAKDILYHTSENGRISESIIVDVANKYGLIGKWNQIIEILKYDGYINNNEEKKVYQFNSPIMREWWNKNVKA